MQGYFFEEKNVSEKIMETYRVALSLFQQRIMENNTHTKQLEASFFLYTEKSLTLTHFKSGHFRFSAKDVFIALTNFNLHGWSILLVHPYQQESNARKAGNWIFGSAKDCHIVSDYQLMQKCHFLSQIVILLCVTQIRHKSVFPKGTHGNDLGFVGGDGVIAWILLFILRRKLWQRCWEAGNEMQYLPSLSAIFDIQSWKTQMVTMRAYCQYPNWKSVTSIQTEGKWVSTGYRWTPITVCRYYIHTQRTHFHWISIPNFEFKHSHCNTFG